MGNWRNRSRTPKKNKRAFAKKKARHLDDTIDTKRFPKDQERRLIWQKEVRRVGWTATPNHLICSEHFEEHFFDRTGQTARLREGAVPTIFKAFQHLQKKKTVHELSKALGGPSQKPDEEDKHQLPEIPTAEKLNRVYKKLQTDTVIGLDKLSMMDRNSREGRGKLTKKPPTEVVRSMYRYDNKGVLIRAQKDLCDCLNERCPGCHWPCPNCKSTKCGPECRCNRRWVYEQVEVEGTEIVLHTPLKTRGHIGGYQYYH